jgi:general secretion pathway protein G
MPKMRTLAPTRMKNVSARRRRRGFTLIEVLLVLAILVILAGLSVVAIANIQGNANNRAAKGQISSLQSTMEIYKIDVGTYPSSNIGLNALVAPPSDLRNPNKWKGPYVTNGTLPVDPWGNPYQYELIGPRQFKIFSAGEDGEPNTADDISNLTEV